MSRRQRRKSGVTTKSRKRKSSSSKKVKKGLWWKVLVGIFVLLITTGIIGYYKTKAYLHSEDFRDLVSLQVSNELGSVGSFGEFTWDGLSGSSTGYKAKGEGAIESVNVEDISLDVDVSFIKRDVFKLKKVKIAKIDSTIDLSNEFLRFKSEKKEKGFWESFLPDRIELYDAEVIDTNVNIITSGNDYSFSGVTASLERNKMGKGFDIKAVDGRFKLPLSLVDNAYLKEANLKLRGEEIYLNDSEFTIQGSGKLELSGYANLGKVASKRYEMSGKLSNLHCKDVFPADWQKNLQGEVVASFQIFPFEDDLPLIKGHIQIKNGTLEALPVLNKIAYYLADPKYRTIKFQKFECDFEKFEDKIVLTNVVLSSKGLLKIEGDIAFDGRKINGLFNVGLPPEKLSNIPGAETMVFLPGKERFNWAKVRLGGTIDDIEEDLTDRLIAAAGRRMVERAFEMGGEVIKPERVQQAADVVGEGLKMLKGDKTILEGINGLLGNGQRKPEEKELTEEEKKKQAEEGKEPEKGEAEDENKGILPIPLPVDPRKIPDILPF